MIKTIVTDLGGVLFSEGKSVVLERLATVHGYDRNLVGAILSSPESISLRKGLISDEDFWRWAQHQLPPEYDSKLIQQEWYESYILDPEIHELIAALRKKYPVVAFSGNIKSRIDFLEAKYRFRHLFNLEIYSYDFHLTKPEKEFVQVMIDKVGVRPEEILYIDDNETYAKPARDLGVNVLIHRRGETERLREALRSYGVVSPIGN
jgi:HAD superfamily hydrolase (TIGR01509 family)